MKTYQVITSTYLVLIIKAESLLDVINELKNSELSAISIVELV